MEKFSTVYIREKKTTQQVKITSDLKPFIEDGITKKWQSLIDTAARLAKVPSGLIMKLNKDTIEVFLKSNTKGNPYKAGEKARLIYGLYCETVIGTQQKLLVPDARKDEVWKENNPDVDIDMIAYLGYPINWPDGEVFGTVCLLDNKENQFDKDRDDLLKHIKQHIEDDLKLIMMNQELSKMNQELEKSNKTKSKFLSLISHDIRGSIGTLDELLKILVAELDNYDKEYLKKILHSLSQNASTSFETLNNMLLWAKNDLIRIKPDYQSADLIEIIDKVLLFFKQSIALKGIKVTKSYYAKKALIETDIDMIGVVLRNIISNAIKYNNNNGTLKISISVKQNKHDIMIQDTGKGMHESTVNKLFQYNKHPTEDSREAASSGIGLMLTKEFADKIGAELIVKSKPNKGTSFTIRI